MNRPFAAAMFFRYNENHDPDNGEFTSGSGGGSSGSVAPTESIPASKAASTAKPVNAASPPSAKQATESLSQDKGSGGKAKTSLGDFTKDKVRLAFLGDKDRTDKFIDQWTDRVGEAPAEFKKEFLGGVDSTMTIDLGYRGDLWRIEGSFLNKEGRTIGTYTRTIDWDKKSAESAFFQLSTTNKDIGKQVLAGNMAMYQKLGIEKVEVHANINVGGYAWAKYGYVPTRSSWSSLSRDILGKLNRSEGRTASGDGYIPSSWEEISEGEQRVIYEHFLQDTHSEFLDSEISNWRDNGEALHVAKTELASGFDSGGRNDWPEWAVDAVETWRKDFDGDVPFTDKQILASISVTYDDQDYDGRGDPEIGFDDSKLSEPNDPSYDKNQLTLPGVDAREPHEALTSAMRDQLTTHLTDAFNDKAKDDESDVEPPDYLSESVEEFQQEVWESKSEDEKYRWADRYGYVREGEAPEDEDDPDADPPEDEDSETSVLRELANSNDPKAIWAIADSPKGKDLLLGTDWFGSIDLKDKETMDRFNAYVGKSKNAK